ncbi:unnamed protein product [Peronospora destructor]|uniref:Ankyrin repeat-containing domain n=1 Tax=Peronospora destructor TaxID=86335 RepID=A0AAV0UMY7_9STRA|nr:unnamed protein product [Peronospora destructor]
MHHLRPAQWTLLRLGGHLEIVKYLQEHRVEGCTKDAMTNAAINGHADVVRFLGEHRQEGPHKYALELAAARGNVDCVEALIDCSIRGCLFEARWAALQAGHPRVAVLLSAWMNPYVRTCSSKHYHVRPGPRWCQKQPHLNNLSEARKTSIAKSFGWWQWFVWLWNV